MSVIFTPEATKVTVTCPYCGHKFQVDLTEYEIQEDTEVNERQMGPEHRHDVVYEGVCPKCNEDIRADIQIWEYPENTSPPIIVESEEIFDENELTGCFTVDSSNLI
ncbi:MAG: hypothetical protein IKR13_03520 [Victivallales bacterium]|nr:hypothetical protein [Victivallales bacterium]